MAADELEKLHGAHLKRDCDILIGVHHNDVVLPAADVQERTAVVGRDRDGLRQVEILAGEHRDLVVNLHALGTGRGEILRALHGEGAGAHAEDEDARTVPLRGSGEHGRGERVVIVAPREPAALVLHGLDAEEHVRRKRNVLALVADLKIVINALALIDEPRLPEGEAVHRGEKAEQAH